MQSPIRLQFDCNLQIGLQSDCNSTVIRLQLNPIAIDCTSDCNRIAIPNNSNCNSCLEPYGVQQDQPFCPLRWGMVLMLDRGLKLDCRRITKLTYGSHVLSSTTCSRTGEQLTGFEAGQAMPQMLRQPYGVFALAKARQFRPFTFRE